MRALMKKRRTEDKNVELRFVGPSGKHKEAIDALNSMGFVDVSDSIPWRECFEADELTPGAMLKGARGKQGLTQKELSRLTGIPQRHISEMENGKRPIGKETVRKLANALNEGADGVSGRRPARIHHGMDFATRCAARKLRAHRVGRQHESGHQGWRSCGFCRLRKRGSQERRRAGGIERTERSADEALLH